MTQSLHNLRLGVVRVQSGEGSSGKHLHCSIDNGHQTWDTRYSYDMYVCKGRNEMNIGYGWMVGGRHLITKN
jgi:hypothetical protein